MTVHVSRPKGGDAIIHGRVSPIPDYDLMNGPQVEVRFPIRYLPVLSNLIRARLREGNIHFVNHRQHAAFVDLLEQINREFNQ